MLATLAAAVPLLAAPGAAQPVEVLAEYRDTASCDAVALSVPHPSHELGPRELPGGSGAQPGFPTGSWVAMGVAPTERTHCVADDGIANEFAITLTNMSPSVWRDLFLVADSSASIGNRDGEVVDLAQSEGCLTPLDPGCPGDALYVDAEGANRNLVDDGDGDPDGLFSPGETWVVDLTNFVGGLPSGTSIGTFAGSSALDDECDPQDGSCIPSTLSILPEPGRVALWCAGAAALAAAARLRRARAAP